MRFDIETQDLPEDAVRQYIDARQTYLALEQATTRALDYRGGMIWRSQKSKDYLVRTSPDSRQTGLGARSPDTESIFRKFTQGKAEAEALRDGLRAALKRHVRMNRALRVGRTPNIVVDILLELARGGMADKFMVVGTNALYAYETAAGARFEPGLLATRDFDLLWDSRKKLSLATQDGPLADGMLGLLRRVDSSFTLREDQKYTAVNKDGVEVDLLRRLGAGSAREPGQLTPLQDDFWVVQARNADWLLSAPRFSEIVVGTSGNMARMTTVDPRAFALFKLWMSEQPDREAIKRARDRGQCQAVAALIEERLPQLSFDAITVFPTELKMRLEAGRGASTP